MPCSRALTACARAATIGKMQAFDPDAKRRWALTAVAAIGVAAYVARRRGPAAGLLAGGAALATELGGDAIEALAQSRRVSRQWTERERRVLAFLASSEVAARGHDPRKRILRALDSSRVDPRDRRALDEALDELRVAVAVFEGHEVFEERPDGPLDRYGLPEKALWAPERIRPVVRFLGRALDEVRLLHTSDIEYTTLLFTFSSRALLIALAPSLGRWSGVRAPLDGQVRAEDVVWALATAWTTSTAIAAPQLAILTMDRGDAGARARRALMAIEVPASIVCAMTNPAWTVTVFGSGWTNYWQRPGPRFYPKRLVVFVIALGAAQAAGLRRRRVGLVHGVAEAAATFAAIGTTGASYGAMVPLSAATFVRATISECSRAQRSAAIGEGALALAARRARELADVLAARGDPPAQTIRVLREQADMLDGQHRVEDTTVVALVASAARESESAGLRVPTATFSHPELRTAVFTEFAARAFADAVGHCHAEAVQHGRGRVLTDVRREGARIFVTVLNDRRDDDTAGGGQGQRMLRDIVEERLPQGRLDQPGAVVEDGPRAGMWEVRFSFDARAVEGVDAGGNDADHGTRT